MNMCCVCGGGESTGGDEPAECVDTNRRTDGTIIDDGADDCNDYAQNPGWCGRFDTDEFFSEQMCCACNGGDRREGEEEDPVEEEDDEEVDDEEGDDEQEGDDEGTIFIECSCACEASDFSCLRDCLECLYPALGDNIVALGDILEATIES